MFLNKEDIYLKDLKNHKILDVLSIFTKSKRSIFRFKICGLGISYSDDAMNYAHFISNEHWVNTVWPLLANKVVSLEFFDTVEFVDNILPAMLNVTQQLRTLKIHNLQYCHTEEFYKMKRIDSLRELKLDCFLTDNINNGKLLGVIPKQLQVLSLKSMWGSQSIIGDLITIFEFCAPHLKTLDLMNIDASPELMHSISTMDMKLSAFRLTLADPIHYDHEPSIFDPIFETDWPLISLTLRADCLLDEHFIKISEKFKNVRNLSLSSESSIVDFTDDGIAQSFRALTKLKNVYLGANSGYKEFY